MSLTFWGRQALTFVERRQAQWANRIAEGMTLAELETAAATLRRLGRYLDTDPLDTDRPAPDERNDRGQ
ncbi:hypothetical protein E1193_08335 [Micromonospora sp. KC606]|uniref:hypothetical protein n=1 Tax=Micromonospora sp. KC606 TaxID=2530379 RepID=UPI001053FAAA|nr:hypothetical protein [Micromonospora sp. KC606]TDC83565.1 hypothetical protein E1193_08335 [Micromonospora sp. KC606]